MVTSLLLVTQFLKTKRKAIFYNQTQLETHLHHIYNKKSGATKIQPFYLNRIAAWHNEKLDGKKKKPYTHF